MRRLLLLLALLVGLVATAAQAQSTGIVSWQMPRTDFADAVTAAQNPTYTLFNKDVTPATQAVLSGVTCAAGTITVATATLPVGTPSWDCQATTPPVAQIGAIRVDSKLTLQARSAGGGLSDESVPFIYPPGAPMNGRAKRN